MVGIEQIVKGGVRTVAQQLHTRSHACFSVRSVAQNAYVFLLVPMETSNSALATTPGRPRKDDPSALKPTTSAFLISYIYNSSPFLHPYMDNFFHRLYFYLPKTMRTVFSSNTTKHH